MATRRLELKQERLAELTTDQLASLAGGTPTLPAQGCLSVAGCLSLRPCGNWTAGAICTTSAGVWCATEPGGPTGSLAC